jgi:DNA-directed RNA polymerase II subunit RPB2
MAASQPNISDLAASLITLYFTNSTTNLSRYAIDSYNYFVTKELPELIFNQNPITILKEPLGSADSGVYAYKTEIFIGGEVDKPENLGIQFAQPIITLDDGKTIRRMFPQEARLRNLTYAVSVLADIRIKVTMTTVSPGTGVGGIQAVFVPTEILNMERKGYPLFNLPIMLRSTLCATNTPEMPRLKSLGECQYDQGGYFIIDGAEKVLVTSEETAFNSVYAGKKPPADLKVAAFARCSSLNPKNKQIRQTALHVDREDGSVRVSLPFIRGAVPLFIVFRALGVQSDEDIINIILPDMTGQEMKILEPWLLACAHDAYPILDTYLAHEFLKTLTKGFQKETVLDILLNNTFMHVPNTFAAKALFLGEMARKLLRVTAGLDQNTDRDDIRNKRYFTAGTLVRELFTECWTTWRKGFVLTIDKEYNYNKTIYEGMNFINLFSEGNLPKMLSGEESLSTGIMRGFRGKWGDRKGVIQPLARISYMDAMSQVRRVSLDFQLKSPGPRHLHPSQCGFFCISEVPSGFSIGITKNASIFTIFSLAENTASMMNWLYTKGGVVPAEKGDKYKRLWFCRVQLNGGTIGFIKDPELLVAVLKLCKQTGCMSPTTSISFNRTSRTVRIYMDEGRPCRPLWILRKKALSPLAERMTQVGWRGLIKGVLAETRDREFFETGFVDPFPGIMDISEYVDRLGPSAGAIEYVDPYEQNEAFISWFGSNDLRDESTHCEIHPSTMFGFVGSMIPFANHNQSPRNQLSCSQSKQGIGFYSSQFMNRFDTYGTQMCYGEAPVARTLYYDLIADGNMSYGTNCIVALMSFDGYNMDDGILFNQSSIERGLFRHLSYKTYDAVEEKDAESDAIIRIGNPNVITSWMSIRPGYDYSMLDDDGIIKEGSMITDKTVLVGRYMTLPESGLVRDASVLPTVFTEGRVEKVTVLHQANGYRLVHVRIFEVRVPELGDKFSSRHGQKGTIGMIRPCYDLPRGKNGVVPDIIVNPHCIPSRMTVAQIMEMITSKVGAQYGAKMNATSFTNDESHHDIMGNALEEAGFNRNGEEIMYAPFSGKQYTSTVFTCPLYFMRLRHLTRDKINSRAAGRKEQRTHQPTGGRGNEGGLRIGEMERDVLIGHGMSDFTQERMMKCSDEATFYVCNSCGQMPIYNESEGIFVCPSCDGPVRFVGDTADTIQMVKPISRSRTTFTKVNMPYTFKLLNQELGTFMNMGMRFINSGSAARLKDESLDWLATTGEGANQLIDLPPFLPPEQPSSSATGAGGIPIEEIKVQVEKEPGVEVQPAVNASLLEQERKRAEDAEAALAQAQEAGPPPETVQITLPGAPQGEGEIGNVVVGPPREATAGPPSQRGGSIALPNLTHPIVGRGSSTNVITLVLPSQGKGAGRPATGNNSAYVPKKKGVAFARLVDEQEREERGESPKPAATEAKGPTTVRVTKEDTDSDIKE